MSEQALKKEVKNVMDSSNATVFLSHLDD